MHLYWGNNNKKCYGEGNMFRKLIRKLNYLKIKETTSQKQQLYPDESRQNIPPTLANVRLQLQEILGECDDLVIRDISIGNRASVKALLVYLDGMVEKSTIEDSILRPLIIESRQLDAPWPQDPMTAIKRLLSVGQLNELTDFNDTLNFILSGEAVIFVEGQTKALWAGTAGYKTRGIEKTETDNVIRGPRESFNEDLKTNITLIRRKLKDPRLKIEILQLGTRTRTKVAICYVKGLAHEEILETVRKRLKSISIDAVLESGYIEECIEDAPMSIFPTIGHTEKPDIVVSKILEGRIAVICDGTPFVLTMPYLFVETLQISEDYYRRLPFSNFMRWVRFLALMLTILLPSLYVALISFHQETIPFKLLMRIAATRQGIPFSPMMEALIMTLAFEILKEAGIRIPGPTGQTVSIVGGLVLGQAAVEASIASNLMIIITSLTAISGFAVPGLEEVIPILRILLLVAANAFGLAGIWLVMVCVVTYMCTLKSVGVPYLFPFAPLSGTDLKDVLVRVPIWSTAAKARNIPEKKPIDLHAETGEKAGGR